MSGDNFVYYHYDPSMVAAIVFGVLFALSTIHHAYQLVRSRSWFMIPLLIGGILEVIGYAARVVSSNQTPNWTLVPFIVQSITLLIAPALFAATVYMILGYIILALDAEQYSLVREKWLTKIFVIGDILSFLVQGAGAGELSSHSKSSQKFGKWIIVVGLLLQLIFFGLFVCVSAVFNKRIRRNPLPRSMPNSGIPWRTHIHILYIVSVLIMIRSVFRLAEYLQGYSGYLLSHEVYLYVFDSVLMFSVMVIFNLRHPSAMRNILTGRRPIGIVRMKELANADESKRSDPATSQFANAV